MFRPFRMRKGPAHRPRPPASWTHHRLGYPSLSCVPTELNSVSPSIVQFRAAKKITFAFDPHMEAIVAAQVGPHSLETLPPRQLLSYCSSLGRWPAQQLLSGQTPVRIIILDAKSGKKGLVGRIPGGHTDGVRLQQAL
jgi:hypothetical protein